MAEPAKRARASFSDAEPAEKRAKVMQKLSAATKVPDLASESKGNDGSINGNGRSCSNGFRR